jgi:1-deoxy-D-xylulose-5-phosphate reductoisomerase
MKRVAVLGSTGSVGTQTLDVAARLGDEISVVALAAGTPSEAFDDQLRRWKPRLAALGRQQGDGVRHGVRVLGGTRGLERLVEEVEPDVVMLATAGLVGLPSCLAALRMGKLVAIANKETLVTAGSLVMQAAAHGGTVLPVDSEHSGIWQCLWGEDPAAIRVITLTTSGGAFRDTPVEDLASATPEQALRHPTWSMGPKITVDSATLMNKGLEIIEAGWLFGVPTDRVEVTLHRQSIVHALVEFIDGSVKAHLSVPDMRLPILNALTYPERVGADLPRLDLCRVGALTFEPIDAARFPAIDLARRAAEAGGTYPAVLNAANEVAVGRFLRGDVAFTDIVPLVASTLDRHVSEGLDIDAVLDADAWARRVCGAAEWSRA